MGETSRTMGLLPPVLAALLVLATADPGRADELADKAARALRAVKVHSAVKSLREGTPEQQCRAVFTLETAGKDDPEALEALIDALRAPSPEVRGRAAMAVGDRGPAAANAVPSLLKALERERDENARWQIVSSFGKIGPRAAAAVPELLKAMRDPKMRTWAGWSLRDIGAASVPGLIEATQDPDAGVRKDAAGTLGEIGPAARASLPALIELLKDPVVDNRRQAAGAMGWIGAFHDAVVPALLKAAKDDDQWLAEKAIEALGRIGPPKADAALPLLTEFLAGDSSERRRAVLKAMARFGGEAVPALQRAWGRGDVLMRTDIAWSLGGMDPRAQGAVAMLLAGLKDPEAMVRSFAVRSLGWMKVGDAAAVAAVRAVAAGDADPDVRLVAMEAMKELGLPGPPPPPATRATSGPTMTSQEAIQAIRALGWEVKEIRRQGPSVSVSLAGSDLAPYSHLVLLRRVEGLRGVGMFGSGVTDAGLEALRGLTGLQTLDLSQCDRITDSGLQTLRGLTGLEALDISSCKGITNAGIAHLEGLSGLGRLNLSWTKVTNAGLAKLNRLKALDALNLSHTRITDAGLRELAALERLESLDLEGTPITGAGLADLKGLANLKELRLARSGVTDAGLAGLKGLDAVVTLNLCDTPVTGPGLKDLAHLPRLHTLALGGPRLTDAGLRELAAIPGLRYLSIHAADKITDAGLKGLAGLVKLERLSLSDCPRLTDAGLRELKPLQGLRVLFLSPASAFSQGARDELAAALPKVGLDGGDIVHPSAADKPPSPRYVVYVIQHGGPSRPVLAAMANELAGGLAALDEGKDVHVVFFGKDTCQENPPHRLAPATDDNKAQALAMTKTIEPVEGGSSPIPALQAAFHAFRDKPTRADRPKVLHLLTTGDFGAAFKYKGLTGLEAATQWLRDNNADKSVRVHPVLFAAKPSEGVEKALRQIASENGGTYRAMRENN